MPNCSRCSTRLPQRQPPANSSLSKRARFLTVPLPTPIGSARKPNTFRSWYLHLDNVTTRAVGFYYSVRQRRLTMASARQALTRETLGQFEQLILTAIKTIGKEAYGVPIYEKVCELSDKRINFGSLYVT